LELLPQDETKHGSVIWHQLNNLESLLQTFQDDLTLFDRSMSSPSEFRVALIAARDGTLTLWNFAMALNAIKASLDASPELRKRMRVAQVERAIRDFWAAIPNAKGLRDSSGHASELMESPKELARNALSSGRVNEQINIGSNGFWLGNLIGRRYSTTTFGGQLVEYDVSAATSQKLNEIVDQVFAAISPRGTTTA
jgi:hypothetical protein